MLPKNKEQEKAIYLRRQGWSYSEIASVIPVSKSSLSLWLRSVKLSDEQISNLALKKKLGQLKGSSKRRASYEKLQKNIIRNAAKQVKSISNKELFLLGVVAYWCEGAKQKEGNISQSVVFTNSDTILLKLFLRWTTEICKIPDDQIQYSIYIHKSANLQKALRYWGETLNIPIEKLGKPILKKHNILTKRKNVEENYHGLIRIRIKKSTNLNRKISGWMKGINNILN